jgi:hypothetical protein
MSAHDPRPLERQPVDEPAPSPRQLWHEAIRGMLAGAVATISMSAVMFAAQHLGLMGEQPPRTLTTRALARAGIAHRVPEPAHDVVAAVAHIGFGAAVGAAFAVASTRSGPVPRSQSAGALLATGVWAGSYLGWGPSLRLTPPAHGGLRPAVSMIVAHWVYGATLVLVLRSISASD